MVMKGQLTLGGAQAIRVDIPKYKYRFLFKDEPDGSIHEIICEDWELGELYRHCEIYRNQGKYGDEQTVHEKVGLRMLQRARLPGAFFVVGTHFRYGTPLIVGVVYPKKTDMPLCF